MAAIKDFLEYKTPRLIPKAKARVLPTSRPKKAPNARIIFRFVLDGWIEGDAYSNISDKSGW